MIVDDEAPARSELKFLLDELGQTEVVAEAASVFEKILQLKLNKDELCYIAAMV